MFPESTWVVNDMLNKYVSDDDGQRLFRAYLADLSFEDVDDALDRLDRTIDFLNQEPLSEESVNQEPLSEEPVEQELDEGNNVVEYSEKNKVDTSEIKLQKLLENVLKK